MKNLKKIFFVIILFLSLLYLTLFTGKFLTQKSHSEEEKVAEKKFQKINKEDDEQVAKEFYRVANNYKSRGLPKQSSEYFHKAFEKAKTGGNPETVIRYCFELANSYQAIQEEKLQLVYYELTIKLIVDNRLENKYPDLMFNSYIQMGKVFQAKNEKEKTELSYSEGTRYFNRLLEHEPFKKDDSILCHLYNEMARVDNYYENTGEMLKHLEAAFVHCDISRNLKESAASNMILGDFYHKVRNLKEAETNYLKAMELFALVKEDAGISAASFNLAILYRDLNLKEKALYHFRKAEKINMKKGLPVDHINNEITRLGK